MKKNTFSETGKHLTYQYPLEGIVELQSDAEVIMAATFCKSARCTASMFVNDALPILRRFFGSKTIKDAEDAYLDWVNYVGPKLIGLPLFILKDDWTTDVDTVTSMRDHLQFICPPLHAEKGNVSQLRDWSASLAMAKPLLERADCDRTAVETSMVRTIKVDDIIPISIGNSWSEIVVHYEIAVEGKTDETELKPKNDIASTMSDGFDD